MTTITSFIIACLIMFLVIVGTSGGFIDAYDSITTPESEGVSQKP